MSAVEHRFGPYGGQYVPETLVPALAELEAAWVAARADQGFQDELAGLLGQATREVQRRGSADVVTQQLGELGLIAGVVARGQPRRLELAERGHQRLRHVLAAVGAEAVLDARGHAASSAAGSAAVTVGSVAAGSGSVAATAAANAASAA